MVKVDLRTITLNVPPQDVITKDNVPVRVNAVAYFRIVGPSDAVVQVENYLAATSQIAQTTLRSVLGQHLLDELLSERDKINSILQGIIDEATSPWGIKVSIVEIKDVEIPSSMQRAMARQAEAERERRAKIISSEGEFQASERLKDAALVLEKHPTALQLRYLQTLIEISGTPSTTIVFPAPIDLLKPFLERPNDRLLSDLRVDPLSGRLVAVAPGRSQRPGAAWATLEPEAPDERESCPFCEGREERTPPEVFALPAGREPDTPGWSVRVVPNKFPAFERQEVVVHAPEHVRSIADLGAAQLELVAEAWQARAAAARADGFASVFAGINEGRAAGSSLPHSHSQLAGFREQPRLAGRPVQALRLPRLGAARRGTDRRRARRARPALPLRGPRALRVPGRAARARAGRRSRARSSEPRSTSRRRRSAACGARRDRGRPTSGCAQDGHWCLEIVPRLTVFASLELATGHFVNPLARRTRQQLFGVQTKALACDADRERPCRLCRCGR